MQKTELSHHELMRRGHRGIQRLWDIDAPAVVACKGWVMGGSFQRALLCDVRIAARRARFDTRFLQIGIHPGGGHTWMLERIVGPQATRAMVVFGEVLDGRNAHLTDGVRRALGREPKDFSDYARDVAATGVWSKAA